ncbi:MAG: tetratricopeptide repeat protein [Opitutae bacterium]|nr:tetratricopeptide repeat protein [Opitutae bacterium]
MKTKSLLAACAALVLVTIAVGQSAAAPTDAAALHKLSQERLQQKSTKEAVELAEQATQADATKPEYFSQLGIALSVRMGEMNFMQQAMVAGKMRKAFEKSIALDPKHVAGLIGLARYYANAPEIAGGSLEKAREFADRVHALNPVLGLAEYANIAEKGEDYAGALAHFEAALKLKPDSANLTNACGRMLAKLGKKDEARARFEAALKINPEFEAAKKALAALDAPAATNS